MKFYLLSDNPDTLNGLRLAGIEGEIVSNRDAFLEKLLEKMKDENIGIILVTSKLVHMCPEVISEIKLKHPMPLIVEIPDPNSNTNLGDTIDQLVFEAIGVKL